MTDPVENPSNTAGQGPGDRLQAARIAAGKSREEMAQHMHLSIQIVEAIEENDFNEITAPIFVRGYLRSYARLVGLSETDIIEQYNQQFSYDDPPIASTSNTPQDISINDARVKWTSYGLVFALIILLGVWWWNNHGTDPIPVAENAPLVSTGDEQLPLDQSMSPVVSADEAPPELEVVTEVATEVLAAPQSPEITLQDSEPPASESLAAEVDAVELEVAVETADENVITEAEMVAEVDSESALETTETVEFSLDRLQIQTAADTWAEIKDSEGTRFIYDLLAKGADVEYVGVAPFSIFLGNATEASIQLNGVEQNFSSHVRSNRTARFQLP